MDDTLGKTDDMKNIFYNSLLGFFGFGIIIVLIGIFGIAFLICDKVRISRAFLTCSWCLIILTMILSLIIAIFLNVGVEILIDVCRVVTNSLNN